MDLASQTLVSETRVSSETLASQNLALEILALETLASQTLVSLETLAPSEALVLESLVPSEALASQTVVSETLASSEILALKALEPPCFKSQPLLGFPVAQTKKAEHTVLVIEPVSECRICQEDDAVSLMDIPCSCTGTLKYAHHKCVQRWCNEKRDTLCEICRQPYRNGYTVPSRPVHPGSIAIEYSDEWDMYDPHPLQLRDPRILAMAAAHHHFFEAEVDDFAEGSSSGTSCWRSVAFIVMAVILLQHTFTMVASIGDDGFTMFLMSAGFLVACFITIRAINMLRYRWRQQEVTMAAVLQRQGGGVHLNLSSTGGRELE